MPSEQVEGSVVVEGAASAEGDSQRVEGPGWRTFGGDAEARCAGTQGAERWVLRMLCHPTHPTPPHPKTTQPTEAPRFRVAVVVALELWVALGAPVVGAARSMGEERRVGQRGVSALRRRGQQDSKCNDALDQGKEDGSRCLPSCAGQAGGWAGAGRAQGDAGCRHQPGNQLPHSSRVAGSPNIHLARSTAEGTAMGVTETKNQRVGERRPEAGPRPGRGHACMPGRGGCVRTRRRQAGLAASTWVLWHILWLVVP